MSEIKHTPGPWVYNGSSVTTASGRLVVTGVVLPAGNWAAFDEVKANTHLIAAAPDMLAALKALDAWWSADFPGGPDGISKDIHSPETTEIWRNVRAAIAKAEGRS